MNKKIEDLFKDGFEGFEQQPKKDLWDKILHQRQVNNLTNNPSHEVTPEHIYSKEFKNFEQQPAEKVWRNVLTHINNRRQQKKYTRWSLLLLLLIGSCSSLVWLYEGKGDTNMAGTLDTKREIAQVEKSFSQIPQDLNNQINTVEKSANIEIYSNGVSATEKKQNYIADPTLSNTLNLNKTTSSTDVPYTLENPTEAKIIDVNTDIVNNHKINAVAEVAEQKVLEKSTISTNPDSLPTDVVDAKKKDTKKKVDDNTSAKKWWHGPTYFKYTSETDMNNEESNWKFGASVGYEWPRVKFTGNSNPIYTQFRKDDESRAFSYNAQAFLVRQIGKPLLVQFGLGYISYGFSGDYHHSIYTVRDSTTPQGNIIHDTTYSYKINLQSHFRINFIELPIMFGYHLGDNRFNFDFKAGYIMQLLQSQNGFVLSPNSHQLEAIGTANELSAKRFGTSAIFSVRANWQIMHELSMFIEGNARYNVKPLMSEATQQQYINSNGINVGAKFHID